MKTSNLMATTMLCLVAATTAAHGEVLQYLTFNITVFDQRQIIDDGTNTMAAPPHVETHNTAELLQVLAMDKNAQKVWTNTTFPVNAKLAVTGDGAFVVMSGTNVLVDASDILSFTNGDHEVVWGKKNDETNLSNPNTNDCTSAASFLMTRS